MKYLRILGLAWMCWGSALALFSCSENQATYKANEEIAELNQLIALIQKSEKEISQGFLLKNETTKAKTEITEVLYKIKVASFRLRDDVQDTAGLDLLYFSYQTFDSLNFLQDDASNLNEIKAATLIALDVVSTEQGRPLDGIIRPLFEKIFDNSLSPFKVANRGNTSKAWVQSSIRDVQYAKVGDLNAGSGGELESWLISPRLQLAKAKGLSLVIEQAINSKTTDRFAEVVSVLVTTEKFSGDPTAVNWTKIAIQKLPKGNDWTFVTTEAIDFSAYEGQEINLAFRFKSEAASNVVWEITKLSLNGRGVLSTTEQDVSLKLTEAGGGETPPPVDTKPSSPDALYKYTFGQELKSGFELSVNQEALATANEELYKSMVIESYVSRDSTDKFLRFANTKKNSAGGFDPFVGSVMIQAKELLSLKDIKKLQFALNEAVWSNKASDLTQELRLEYQTNLSSEQWLQVKPIAPRTVNKEKFNNPTKLTKTLYAPISLGDGVTGIKWRLVYNPSESGTLMDANWLLQNLEILPFKD